MRTRNHAALLLVSAALLAGCGARSELRAPAKRDGTGANDAGAPECEGGSGQASVLPVRIRDFHRMHPDFEAFLADDPGIVEPQLGEDGKPVYAGLEGNPTTTGQENFDQWYHDVHLVNEGVDRSLLLAPSAGSVVFESDAFFPIDGELFGPEGLEHNFHFTMEGHTSFRYQGGEVFTFGGDDDFWAFIDGELAIDLGGVHGTESASVSVDTVASQIGLEIGSVYPLDIFFAERHTTGSTFAVRLTQFELCQ